MKFLSELRRRNVIRMGGLYIVGAWLLIQIAETLLPIFKTPDWVLQTLVVLLALGFVPALVLSWVFEITPEGIQRDAGEAAAVDPNGLRTAKRLDLLTLLGVVALFAFVAADRYWPKLGSESTFVPSPDAGEVVPASKVDSDPNSESVRPIAQKSIAVLPFADLSPDHDQEYFSDGISEEILNALAKLRDLKVAGRTSSFAFKGKNEDLRSIGKTLGVAHILEGSVRKQGARVRITAQLIQVEDGFHLWSETYDGDLDDIFELQENIARAITDSLQVILQGDPQQRLVPVATENSEAYGLFLQASAIFNRREGAKFAEAIADLEQAVRLDPSFARAHARLGALHALAPQYAAADLKRSLANSYRHAERAVELDPNLAEGYAVLAQSALMQRDYVATLAYYERALEIDPNDVLSNFWRGTELIATGYLQRGDEFIDRALAVDPLMPNALMWRGARHVFAGNLNDGERMLRRAAEFGLSNVGLGLTNLEQARGNIDEARMQLASGLEIFMSTFPPGAPRLVAEGHFGNEASKAAALKMIDALLATEPAVIPGAVPYALIRLGEPKRALEVMGKGPTDADALVFFLLWSPTGTQARRLPEFSEFAKSIGLASTWDALGAPDLCRKQASGAYTCD